MRANKKLLAAGALVTGCLMVVWFSRSIQGGEETFEIRPQVSVPFGYTPTIDTSRLIDLISQLTAQNQEVTQNQLSGINADLQIILEKLESVERNLDALCVRMERIEKSLGVESAKPLSGEKSEVQALREKEQGVSEEQQTSNQ